MQESKSQKTILWFDEIGIEDVPFVGGKNASLGEMHKSLTARGINIPNGFAVTSHAYRQFIAEAGIGQEIREALEGLDANDTHDLEARGAKARRIILNATIPLSIQEQIFASYKKLEEMYEPYVDVAVRSSATAEDLPDASFAGQQDTFLNVVGEAQLLDCCRKCFASLFTNRAINYRVLKGYDHFDVALSICVQKMVRSDKASSGVIFTLDTESGFKDVVLLTGSWGLGENVVQGAVNPDEYLVAKVPLMTIPGSRPIIQRKLGSKELTMIYSDAKYTKNIFTERAKRDTFCLNDDEVLKLTKWAAMIEEYYTGKRQTPTPMDIEWAKDGISNELFIVQARPETVQSQRDYSTIETYHLNEESNILCTGTPVGNTISVGKSRVLRNIHDIHDFQAGEVLVTEMTDPDWEPILKIAKAVVTNRGGRTCHAAIISRELGIPCMVGCKNATEKILPSTEVTIDCASGAEVGRVFEGALDFEITKHSLGALPKLKTKICMNVANPAQGFQLSFLPHSGVGLARMEFIISNHIKAHPLALLKPDSLPFTEQLAIETLIKPYESGKEYFVETLAQGIGMLATAFYPERVILRFSDFKTNEYASLLGGKQFEPCEDNAMMGWRGASRYYDEKYKEGFAMECAAVKKVREVFGLSNLHVMIPFCRTIKEAKLVVAEMEANGLSRSDSDLQIMGMCEIPSNVILADEFLEIFDGYSIGSNDLTQLTLGVDRNSEIVSSIFDERDMAVKKCIKSVIETCNKKGKYVGICGQGPSDYPEFAAFLVECGIQSISLNPDTVISTTFALAEIEKKLNM